jgi:hypothetical protein
VILKRSGEAPAIVVLFPMQAAASRRTRLACCDTRCYRVGRDQFLGLVEAVMSVVRTSKAGHSGPVTIACINHATVDLGVPLAKLIAALQKCYDQHFLPVWGYPVRLYVATEAKPSDWQLVFFDDATQAGVLGYHALTKDGQPAASVFVKSTLAVKQPVSVVACHELLEMAIDPVANLWAQAADGTEYAYEVSDAVEEDTFAVDGIQMSNFLHPSWFEPFQHPKGTKFDHLGLLKAPFTMTKGGYAVVKQKQQVKQVFGSRAKEKRFAHEDRRGHRSEYRKPKGKGLLIPAPTRRKAKRSK